MLEMILKTYVCIAMIGMLLMILVGTFDKLDRSVKCGLVVCFPILLFREIIIWLYEKIIIKKE